jgi:hypothetical protein
LHAGFLGFKHPTRGVDLSFTSDLPLELEQLIATLHIESI